MNLCIRKSISAELGEKKEETAHEPNWLIYMEINFSGSKSEMDGNSIGSEWVHVFGSDVSGSRSEINGNSIGSE